MLPGFVHVPFMGWSQLTRFLFAPLNKSKVSFFRQRSTSDAANSRGIASQYT